MRVSQFSESNPNLSNLPIVEHGIKEKPKGRTRRPSMSSFYNQLSQVEVDASHNNPHATPTPVEMAGAYRLLQDQLSVFRLEAPNANSQAFLDGLIDSVLQSIEEPPSKVAGVPQSYLDALERVPKKQLKKTDTCPICGEAFLDDEYPLVVELPCHPSHRFDLDCVGPWLRLQGTCPLDRKDLMKKEVPKRAEDEDVEEDYESMYA
jgi:hypothetical protein